MAKGMDTVALGAALSKTNSVATGFKSAVANDDGTYTVTFIDGSTITSPYIKDIDTLISEKNLVNQTELNSIKSELSEDITEITDGTFTETEFDITTKCYADGTVANPTIKTVSSANYAISNFIKVKKGEVIKFHATGYGKNIAMISVYDIATNVYTRECRSSVDEGVEGNYQVKDYTYTVENDGYILLSFMNNYEHTLYIKHIDTVDLLNTNLDNNNDTDNFGALAFKKVVCCGDSFTKGYISNSSGTLVDVPLYSWVQHLCDMTGNKWCNCGVTGATSKSWRTNENGLAKAQSLGKSQAYILGLGINDSRNATISVGTSADIGTDTESYYGLMSKIVVELATISPNAYIFMCTCPDSAEATYDSDRYDTYNQAVKDIVNYYRGTYKIYCIDYQGMYSEIMRSPNFVANFYQGHPTACGHSIMAKKVLYCISDLMKRNKKEFLDIPWIEYDEIYE